MSIRRRIKVETRDRRDVLNEAVITQEQFFERFFAQPQSHQFLFGAGMSVSAGIPLTKQIIDEIIFAVEEAPEGGYVARALGAAIFTEADDLEALREAVRDAVRCHFDEIDRPKVIRLHVVREEVLAA